MKLVDTNILIFAANRQSPHHARVRQWCGDTLAAGEPIGLPWLAVVGFLRIATSTQVFAPPLTMAEATSYIRDWLDITTVTIADESPDHWERLLEVLTQTGWRGKNVSDASLAALALCHGATLASCDRDFAQVEGLDWTDPLHEPTI